MLNGRYFLPFFRVRAATALLLDLLALNGFAHSPAAPVGNAGEVSHWPLVRISARDLPGVRRHGADRQAVGLHA